ncbi:Uncharacterised protein [Mycobacteroides abscessus subsp. abscessus]|nr:Uncharacterised protein [Mycobacteroides abscessus subsp. abscessus]
MQSRISAVSSTFRHSGPITPRDFHRSTLGAADTRPRWSFSPYKPHHDDGSRIDPPPSPPIAAGTMPDATADAVPPDDPAVECRMFHGFRVYPCADVSVNGQMPNSGIAVIPRMTAPAARRRFTTSASSVAGVVNAAPP